jgi:hypothetical protein
MMVLTIDNFDIHNVYFGNTTKNNVISEGRFSHINYSTHYFSLNAIYLSIPLKMKSINSHGKTKIFFKKKENEAIINKLKLIEEKLLENMSTKTQLKINQYLENEIIVVYSKEKPNFSIILKISGIWETEEQCGLSFKFIIHPLKNE